MNSQFFSVIINVHRILRSSQFLGIGQVFSYLGLASSVLIDPVSISSVLSKLEPVKMLHERNMYRKEPRGSNLNGDCKLSPLGDGKCIGKPHCHCSLLQHHQDSRLTWGKRLHSIS
ncbi:uncharacterized protein LOC109825757 [Asparagus officinalis]|uniref:uncharacterized protein LOC109825757 n=1 Tax=Asparagus officinalis TaxID=4686 RepID=UPI00098E5FAC|nr:uncharacterized protein LOC109825757 [Asparagus officinalis]